jgi:DNA-binding response OmpR family regulator
MPTPDPVGAHVLLVDDDPAVAKALSTLLRRAGFAVSTEAEGLIAAHRFDAMVLDLRMPEMRGDAFYYLACVRQPWLSCRALFVTGDITEQAEEIIENTGCRFLIKPFRGEQMISELRLLTPATTPLVDRAG